MPDWLEPTIVLAPYAAWVFLGVGVPWALALLPRPWWRARVIVLALALALGPLLHSTWLFALGTFGRLTPAATFAGSGALTALGAVLAARRIAPASDRPPHTRAGEQQDASQPAEPASLAPAPHRQAPAARLIALGIVLLVLLNVVITAYWPFIAYDTQWVYGYNARIFVLEERIPDDMGYYPQLIPLTYATMQQVWGALGYGGLFDAPINDHAARVVVPWFNIASILMAYTLGLLAWRSRRAALLSAAVWACYPHMMAWAGAGDLEIPLTLYVTGASAFFIAAWRSAAQNVEQAAESHRLAVISGLLLAGALWTKPTGGAVALGVALAVAGALVLRRFDWRAWWPQFRIVAVAGLASAPIGGMWYLRNLLLGHVPVVFPADYWHDFAQRSGQELGWPLLIAALVALGLVNHKRPASPQSVYGKPPSPGPFPKNEARGERRESHSPPSAQRGGGVRDGGLFLPLLGFALMLAGALPSALKHIDSTFDVWLWTRGDLSAGPRMGWLEWLPILLGAALIAWSARGAWARLDPDRRVTVLLIGALMLPYAVVWFLNFSYHYRLSFAIVPLAGTLVAALIDGWLWDWLAARRAGRIAGIAAIIGAVALAGTAAAEHSVDVWRDGGLPDDVAKYDQGNPGLMVVVHMLEDHAAQHGGSGPGNTPVVAIPGEDRLPFFFPTWEIRNSRLYRDLPAQVEDLQGADIYVENASGLFLVQRAGKWPNSLHAEADLGTAYHERNVRDGQGEIWPTVLEPIPLAPDGSVPFDDGNFRYAAFTIHPEAREAVMQPQATPDGTVLFGDFARFIGHDMVNLNWYRGEKIIMWLYWRPTESAPPPRDYSIYVHLLDPDGNLITQWDNVPLQGTYPTRFWRPGESLLDYWVLLIPEDIPAGPAHVRIGIYDPLTGERVPVTVDGEPAGDGLTIETRIEVK